MKIMISDVHRNLKQGDSMDMKHIIGKRAYNPKFIDKSAHGRGSIRLSVTVPIYFSYSGIYVTCIDNEGYPL